MTIVYIDLIQGYVDNINRHDGNMNERTDVF